MNRVHDTAGGRAGGGHPWSPAPAVWFSIAVLAGAVGAVVVQPALWPWALGAIAVNFLLLFAAVFFPRSRVLGANLSRLSAPAAARREICLTFDDGPDPEVTPRVLDLLDRYQAKASFFCVGEKARACPEIVREIARRGHGVENHSHRHSMAFAIYGIFRVQREVELAQATLSGITGRTPRFFRAPVGLRSPLVDPVLARCGLTYVSWTRRGLDTIDRDPQRVLARLCRGLAAGDILLLHDHGKARTPDGTPVVLAVLPELLRRLRSMGFTPVTLATASDGT